MRHSEAARPQPDEVSQEEKPKFDIEKEAAAAKAETEAKLEKPTQFARDMAAYRDIDAKLALKTKERSSVNEASEALGRGSHAAEALARSVDSEIADLKKQQAELVAGYGENSQEFLAAKAEFDKLVDKYRTKRAKLDELEGMTSFINFPGGERGAKKEMEFLNSDIDQVLEQITASTHRFDGRERVAKEPSADTVAALAEIRQMEADRVAAEKADEEPILLTQEMRKKPAAEKQAPPPLPGSPERPIEVTDDMIVGVPGEEDAELLVYEAFKDMKPISNQEMDAAVKAKQFTPERKAELDQAVAFLENRAFDLTDGVDRETRVQKPDGSFEVKSVHEAGTKELAQTIKEKYGLDIEAQNDANAVSAFKRFGFGLRKLFNPGLRRLVKEHNDKADLSAKLTGEANATKKMMQDPGAYRARMQDSALKMFALRQRMKKPAPVINVKVR